MAADEASILGRADGMDVTARAVLESLGRAVIVTSPGGDILFWNGAAEALYGWSAAEVVGRSILEVTPAEQSAEQAAQIVGQLAAGESWEGEFRVQRRDGSSFLAVVTDTPVVGADGTVTAIVGVSSDVSEIRRLGGEMESREGQFRSFVENSGDVLAVADAEGVIDVLAGPVADVLGFGAEALLGTSLFELVQPQDMERARQLWSERTAGAGAMPAEDFWMMRADRRWVCLNLLANNRLDDPAIGGVVITIRDVTESRNNRRARLSTIAANSALLLAGSEDELFKGICRVVVDDDTYHLAWIGVADAARPLGVRMVAFADHSSAYFEALEHLAGEAQTYRGPLFEALETNQLYVVDDIEAMAATEPWRQLALDHGFRSLVALPLRFDHDDFGVLAIYAERPHVFTEATVAVLSRLADDISYGVNALRDRAGRDAYRVRFEASLEAAVKAVATAAELRDPYTAGHQRHVAELASAIAARLGIDAELAVGISVAASIHDIGKLVVPAEILSKPGRLSDAEYALIQVHSQAGHDIVAGIDFAWPIAEMILDHHERLDGSGYPRGLRGDEIGIAARILAVADTTQAMCSHRPYRVGLGIDVALAELADGRGIRYDADVVDACTQLYRDGSLAAPDP